MMPGKKKKYNARFPPARIKKIMQTDEEVGKVAAPVPVIISRALELFAETLLSRANDVTLKRGARTLTPSHLKLCIETERRFDFLKELVSTVPDLQEEEVEEGDILPLQPSRPKPRGRGQAQFSHVNHGDRGPKEGTASPRPTTEGLVPSSLPPARGTGKRRGRPPKVNGNIGAGILRFHPTNTEKRKVPEDKKAPRDSDIELPKKSSNGLKFRPILPSQSTPSSPLSPYPPYSGSITSKHPAGDSTSRLHPPPVISRSYSVPTSAAGLTPPPLNLSTSAMRQSPYSPKNCPTPGTAPAITRPPHGGSFFLSRPVSKVSNGLNGSAPSSAHHHHHNLPPALIRTEAGGAPENTGIELKKSLSFPTFTLQPAADVDVGTPADDGTTAAAVASPSSLPAIDSGTHNIIRSLNSASVKSGVQRLPGSSWTSGKPSQFARKETLDEDYDC